MAAASSGAACAAAFGKPIRIGLGTFALIFQLPVGDMFIAVALANAGTAGVDIWASWQPGRGLLALAVSVLLVLARVLLLGPYSLAYLALHQANQPPAVSATSPSPCAVSRPASHVGAGADEI